MYRSFLVAILAAWGVMSFGIRSSAAENKTRGLPSGAARLSLIARAPGQYGIRISLAGQADFEQTAPMAISV